MNDFIESSSVYIAITIIFVRILFSKCLFYFTFLTLLTCFWFLSPEPDTSNFSWSFCFFKMKLKAFWELILKCGEVRILKCLLSSYILTTAGFSKILFPFLQLCTSVLRNYLWSQEYIITLAYCYVLVYISLLGLYTVL